MLRLRGKGVPDVNGYGRGDLLVVVNIPIPAKVNAEEKRLLEQLSQGDNFKEAAPTAGGNLFDRMKSFFHENRPLDETKKVCGLFFGRT